MNHEPTKRPSTSLVLALLLLAIASTACHFHGGYGGCRPNFHWCAPVRHCR